MTNDSRNHGNCLHHCKFLIIEVAAWSYDKFDAPKKAGSFHHPERCRTPQRTLAKSIIKMNVLNIKRLGFNVLLVSVAFAQILQSVPRPRIAPRLVTTWMLQVDPGGYVEYD
ncbi:hypothetical protein EDB19DRAFT_1828846 [Suillus lakei]|nr:hypothetical protein EDB19DRAFT_1828846 [Suillus lakei]